LVTPDLSRVGQMSCNPAIGGVAKGVVAREVDALGGVMGRATDASRIHFKMLNRSKGPAVWGPRAQCDRARYPVQVRRILEELPTLELLQEMVSDIAFDEGRVAGVRIQSGGLIVGASVVVTAGTFLRGKIHVGGSPGVGAGRAGEAPSVELAEAIEAKGIETRRFKTGTPPRVDGRAVDFSKLVRQDGEDGDGRFSSYVREAIPDQRACWITWTGDALKEIVRENLTRSALYGGAISGRGPRYCPSIEDKIVRFPDAPRHQVFLEPEGLDTTELYVNGLSTSLPPEVQLDFLRTLPGLEEVRMTRAGYAIEYDYFPPQQLRHTLEVRVFPGLFFAGQINGTTGYEEAAGQGVVAGANAALSALGAPPLVLGRDQAYIGVLVDDLVTRGVDEPYRLFTSRSEFRLLLRQDNAPRRLGPIARDLGLLTDRQRDALHERLMREDRLLASFRGTLVPATRSNPVLEAAGYDRTSDSLPAAELLRRPGVRATDLLQAAPELLPGSSTRIDSSLADASGDDEHPVARAAEPRVNERSDDELLIAVEVELKYEGYVARERDRAARLRDQADFELPRDLDYQELATLTREAREKLARAMPSNLSQAARVVGVSPADLQNLVMEVKRRRKRTAT
jgi:tRNA uridine 5-carboxymethylaminomethyl modification enzyme